MDLREREDGEFSPTRKKKKEIFKINVFKLKILVLHLNVTIRHYWDQFDS